MVRRADDARKLSRRTLNGTKVKFVCAGQAFVSAQDERIGPEWRQVAGLDGTSGVTGRDDPARPGLRLSLEHARVRTNPETLNGDPHRQRAIVLLFAAAGVVAKNLRAALRLRATPVFMSPFGRRVDGWPSAASPQRAQQNFAGEVSGRGAVVAAGRRARSSGRPRRRGCSDAADRRQIAMQPGGGSRRRSARRCSTTSQLTLGWSHGKDRPHGRRLPGPRPRLPAAEAGD